MTRVEVEATKVVAGGDALGRMEDGRVAFITGALPGERVVAEVTEDRPDYLRAHVTEVVNASANRVIPPCPNVARGCGGCGWQHIERDAQRSFKEDIVRDALVRIARIQEDALPRITTAPDLAGGGRTTIRVAVKDGRAHFHRGRSAELVDAAGCLVVHAAVGEVLDDGLFGAATDAVVRVGVASGERAALLSPNARDAALPPDVDVVDGSGNGRGVVHEVVAGRSLQVSIRSFFQSSPEAAERLVMAVLDAMDPARPTRVADLYSGVGLFAGAVAARFDAHVTAVERAAAAVADAKVNLRDVDAIVERQEVGRWRPDRPVDAVVADPARPGLGKPGVGSVVASDPRRLVLVSCDAASLARDARLLAAHGFALESCLLIDAFPHTPHVEVVSAFARGAVGEPH